MTTDFEDGRLTAEDMDARRKENIAYEYLCHLEEAKVWIEACIKEELPGTTELEEGLRNGVFLAKIAHFINPTLISQKKIYDSDQAKYNFLSIWTSWVFQLRGLHFRHTDNINYWLKGLDDVGLPKSFWPETTDIYDRKNMPKCIYCLHALSLYLFKLGKAPQIQDLYGKINFTEDEISAMRKELEKYGIQMPAFSKIGGILANEMPVDEAALHAAVIAVNDAIDRQVAKETVSALQNPAAHLVNVNTDLADSYQAVLFDAKDTKAESARNKSTDPDSSYIPDVYDELLTQAELQGNVNMVNARYALGKLHQAVSQHNVAGVLAGLRKPQLGLRDVKEENADIYTSTLLKDWQNKLASRMSDDDDDVEEDESDHMLGKHEVQAAVYSANSQADSQQQQQRAIQQINRCLQDNDCTATLRALQNPHAGLPSVEVYSEALYHEELRNMRAEKMADLDHEELTCTLPVLSAVAKINKSIDTQNSHLTYSALTSDNAHLGQVDSSCSEKYIKHLSDVKATKRKEGRCEFLTHYEIQQCVNDVNQNVTGEHERIEAVHLINEAIDSGDASRTLAALQLQSACITDVDPVNATHYHNLLTRVKKEKAKEMHDSTAELWCEEIQNTVVLANDHAREAHSLSVGIAAINISVETENSGNLLNCLQNRSVGLHSVTSQCGGHYLPSLQEFKAKKSQAGEVGSGWMMNKTQDGFKFYFNVHTLEQAWDRPQHIKKDYSILTKDEIQKCITEVTSAYDRQLLFKANEKLIILLQARVRGYLARQRLAEHRDIVMSQIPSVIKIQSWWRMVRTRRWFLDRMDYMYNVEDKVITLQSSVRMLLARKKYHNRLAFFKKHEDSVIKIQSFMRSNWAKKDYKALVYGVNPHISIVRRFVHLLDIGDLDYDEEIEVERLRQQVVTDIRSNQHLETDLNAMDIKIGLLVKNRITLQDVVSQHKTLKKYNESSSTLNRGLKALSKASRERLEAYQHLFYLLQTNPNYLARLIFEMPQSRTTKFMESVILTLYNYASNTREEYLLLNLFRKALQEEIVSKVDKMSDIVTGNPMVIKMIVSFNRNSQGQGCLRELLQPLVLKVIEDKRLVINTNPVEVYKQWVNSTESQTGKASGLPYEVTVEQALSHSEVRERINQSMQSLQKVTEMFLSAILASISSIPYGMRYMAKILRDTLKTKFPGAPEKDILKIVGNLIYYRYINSAIVAPDAFDIIDMGPNRVLTNDQRRNLGSLAKILQFAASNKGFGGESAHLASVNKYIMDAHSRFKQYFRAICEVEEPELHFNIDQYTDVTRITKPIIFITIAEIIDTHKLLCEHADSIAPDNTDPLHELLDDLGEVPDVSWLIGDAGNSDDCTGPTKSQLAKTEISLTLSNKFEVPENSQADTKNLLLRTKRLIVELIRCQKTGDNLTEVMYIPATKDEEYNHQMLIKKRERMDMKVNRKTKLVRQSSSVSDMRLPLEAIKQKILLNLQQLEQTKETTRQDNYQSLVNSIVQDIRNQRVYRQHRRQDMRRLRQTLKCLASKRSFFEEQINYYNEYVKTCLDNLKTKGKKSGKKALGGHKAKGTIKYNAARLKEKGIMLDIIGLPTHQFKNVLFEITATDVSGVFDVNAKFMGVQMEKVELSFQDLLQLQYEGVAVLKMFDRATVNVNLLIFLINKKFYGK